MDRENVDIEGVASQDAQAPLGKRQRSESIEGGTPQKKRRFSEASNASSTAGKDYFAFGY